MIANELFKKVGGFSLSTTARNTDRAGKMESFKSKKKTKDGKNANIINEQVAKQQQHTTGGNNSKRNALESTYNVHIGL